MIMKQNENDEVSKYQKCDKFYQNKHDVSPLHGFVMCQEKYVNIYLVTTFYTEGNYSSGWVIGYSRTYMAMRSLFNM